MSATHGKSLAPPPVQALDTELILRYDRPVPRYTSYPTALQFRDDIPPEELLQAAHQPGKALALYIHLPFCETRCWYCGCTTEITRDQRAPDNYLDLLEREIELTLPYLGKDRPVVDVHLGGGSPNYLTPAQIQRLGRLLHQQFNISEEAAMAVELDPRKVDPDRLEALAEAGFWRASLGVQDLDPEVQEAIHRIQPANLCALAVERIREAGFRSLNIDLIYGLPLQSESSYRKTLATVLDWQPERVAVFSYAHVPWIKPAQKILERKGLPDAREKLALFLLAMEVLIEGGYQHIGLDHFAHPEDELALAQREGRMRRNFQGYTTQSCDELAGFGVSAISQTAETYRQNAKTLAAWQESLQKGQLPLERGYGITTEDQLRREVIHQLMASHALDFGVMGKSLGVDFREHFGEALERLVPLAKDGLVEMSEDGLAATPTGRILIRHIAAAFDGYFNPAPQRHAKGI